MQQDCCLLLKMQAIRLFHIILCFFIYGTLTAQRVSLLHSGTEVSLRGLSAVTDKVIWVSGSEGTVGRSTDGGHHWQWMKVPGYASRDFRDIEAFDAGTAVVMAVAEPAIILKTRDGGKTWKKVFEDTTSGMFLDAMDFSNPHDGIVIGDPVQGKFFVARSADGGDSWKVLPDKERPAASNGEACFAASGTNVRALGRHEACFVSGGVRSRFFWKEEPAMLPLIQGRESTGANSIAVWPQKAKPPLLVVVGGDFTNDSSRSGNCAVSRDGGRSWISSSTPPMGYRSSIEYIDVNRLVTCGLNGVDLSHDGGLNWNAVSTTGFHVCRKARKGQVIFFAGGKGRIGKLVL